MGMMDFDEVKRRIEINRSARALLTIARDLRARMAALIEARFGAAAAARCLMGLRGREGRAVLVGVEGLRAEAARRLRVLRKWEEEGIG